MTKKLRVLLTATCISFGALVNTLAPTIASAQTTLPVERVGSDPEGAETATSSTSETTEKPAAFGRDAVFPSVEVVSYREKFVGASKTRLPLGGADVTLRISNKGTVPTDPVSLRIKDNNLLMRQAAPIKIPSLDPGVTQLRNFHLEADLEPTNSLGLEDASGWRQRFRARCDLEMVSILEWSGSQALMPRNGRFESKLTLQAQPDLTFQVDPNAPICDSTHCVRPCVMAKEIRKQLDGHAVGYSFFVGLNSRYEGHGEARTQADGTSRDFTSKTKITVASVSKIVTAIAAVRLLDQRGISLDATIGPYLPSDWSVSDYVANLTFAQLLSQSSGIKDYGNVANDYATLKAFYTQPIRRAVATPCNPTDANGNLISTEPGEGINRNDTSRCYSNFNFSIFRLLLPRVAGLKRSRRPDVLARQYTRLVQENVFDLVGQKDVECKPPSESPATYAFAYRYPGTNAGANFGDEVLRCGGSGWHLSVEDIAKVLLSINARDGKVLPEAPGKHLFDDMRTRQLGWDVAINSELEKNGGYGANCDNTGKNCAEISTSVAIFGPVVGPRLVAVLFINSNISGGTSDKKGAHEVLLKAYQNAKVPK